MLTAWQSRGTAQTPEPVSSIVRQLHDYDWYRTQAIAWKNEIDKGSADKMAWVYWFRANRMAMLCDATKWGNEAGNYFEDKKEIVAKAEKSIPNSFEYYYLKIYDDGAGSDSGAVNIMRAQALRPYDPLLLPWLLNHYQFTNDRQNVALTCKKWFESNEMPQEMLTTAYNNLVSLEPNAILLVNGDNDTYPYWILQNVQKIRQDVVVVNVALALIDQYRTHLFEDNGIEPLQFSNDTARRPEIVVRHLFETVVDRPVYVSLFVDTRLYTNYTDRLYITGLSLRYSKKAFDNLKVLRENVENRFMLDFLRHSFYHTEAQSVVNQMNAGYLAIFQKLFGYYRQHGETEKARKLKELAQTVAASTGKTEWLKYFEQ